MSVNVLKFGTFFLSGLEFTKTLIRITNRGGPDQTASSEAVGSGSSLLKSN